MTGQRPTLNIDPEALRLYRLALPDGGPLDLAQIFGNLQPVEAEIGYGKGNFLIEATQAFPATNWLGFEVKPKLIGYGCLRLWKRRLPNARVLGGDALALLRTFFPAASFRCVHVYFPDPWWKKKHWKRRLFTPEFFAEVTRVLEPQGRLELASDVAEVFDAMVEAVGTVAVLTRDDEGGLAARKDLQFSPSNFERKARRKGVVIQRGSWVKQASPPPPHPEVGQV